MTELLRLREAQLANARAADNFAQQVVHAAARAHRAEQVVLEFVPVAREAEIGDLRTRRARTRIVVGHKRLRELDRAILAVVGMHDDIAILHARVVAHHAAGDVLVGHGRAVGRLRVGVERLDGFLDGRDLLPFARDDAVVGGAGERPVLHAVHAIVAAHDRADRGVAHGGKFLLEARDVFKRRARRRVTSVKERVHDDLPFRKFLARALHQLEEMLLMRMHAFVLQEAEEVECGVVGLPVRNQLLPLQALEEFAGGEAVVDALELLHNDTSRAHVEVAHLGAALIAVGQADGLAAAVQETVRIARADLVDGRRLRRKYAVAVGSGVHTPAVANDQYDGSHVLL